MSLYRKSATMKHSSPLASTELLIIQSRDDSRKSAFIFKVHLLFLDTVFGYLNLTITCKPAPKRRERFVALAREVVHTMMTASTPSRNRSCIHVAIIRQLNLTTRPGRHSESRVSDLLCSFEEKRPGKLQYLWI